jgi:hypothetical protein
MKKETARDRVRSAIEISPLDRAGRFGLLSGICEGSGLHSKRKTAALFFSLFPYLVFGELDLDRGSGSLLSAGSARAALPY